MDNIDFTKYALDYARTRRNLLAVVIFTLINVIMATLGTGYYFLFSATGPMLILEIFQQLSAEFGGGFLTVGVGLALLGVFIYFLFWLLSKKHRVCILLALIIFSIDTILFLGLIALEFEASLIIDLAFHAWVLYYLIIGTIAWAKLKTVSPETLQSITQEENQKIVAHEINTAVEDLAPKEKASEEKE